MKFYLICDYLFVLTVKEQGKPITVVYVPSHLYHMMFELFKVRFAGLVSTLRKFRIYSITFIYVLFYLSFIYPVFGASNKGVFYK